MSCTDWRHKAIYELSTAVLAAVLLSGISPSVLQAQQGRFFERILELHEGSTFQLTNTSGDITVRGVTGRYATIRGIKTVVEMNIADSASLLEATAMIVEEGEESISVAFRQPPAVLRGEAAPVSVNITIEIPLDVALVLRSTSGNIKVSGMEGEISLESDSGSISVTDVAGYVSAGSVRGTISIEKGSSGADANTVSGDITLTDVDDRIRATCVSGDITIRGGVLTEIWANNTGGDIQFSGPVAIGARYQLMSHSGDIEFIAEEESAFQVSLSTVSGSISAPLELNLTGNRTSRRSLIGIIRDSGASVELTAFSGDITLITFRRPGRTGMIPSIEEKEN